MARYIGPTSRIARRFGEPIFGPDKALAKKAYGPGQRQSKEKRKRVSLWFAVNMELVYCTGRI
jgi:small subunit ribosomal protein S4